MDTVRLLLLLGVGFFGANLRLLAKFVAHPQIRSLVLVDLAGEMELLLDGLLLVVGAGLALVDRRQAAVLREHRSRCSARA